MVEIRARVLADAGVQGGLAIWAGHQQDPGIAFASITTNAVYYGASHGTVLIDAVDNSTDFHIYRVVYQGGPNTYSVYRDGQLLASGLGAGLSVTGARLIVGDTGSAGSVKAEVDYIRWEVAHPWAPSPPAADCDGDGLLNNQEDVNGNGVVDPEKPMKASPTPIVTASATVTIWSPEPIPRMQVRCSRSSTRTSRPPGN